MTLQQIAYIKKKFKGLKLRKEVTHMFTDRDWGASFTIKMLYADEILPLVNYCKDHNILMFIGSQGIYFQ